MDSSRVSVRSIAEWLVAAAILAGITAGGTVALREVHTVTAVMPVSARDAAVQVPTAGVPERAVSIPVLLLSERLEVRVGDAAADVMKRLVGARELQPVTAERGPLGVRETRVIEAEGVRFVLVLEPFEHDAALRVAAIYLP